MAKNDSIETIIGPSVTLEGNFDGNGDIVIEGAVNGSLKTSGNVRIGQEARVKAEIKANSVLISGEVRGNIEAEDRIDLSETAKVSGNIKTKVLQISAGASFNGKSSMNGHDQAMKSDEKIKKEDK